MIRLTFLFLYIFFLAYPVRTQILNVEKERKTLNDTTTKWIGNMNFGFNLQKRENPVLTFSNVNNLAYISKKHLYLFINDINFTQVSNNSVVSNGYAHVRINFWNRNKVSTEFFAQAQYDQIRGLKQRLLAGIVGRLLAVNTERSLLAIGFGNIYEYEVWSFEGENAQTRLFKNSSYLSLTHNFNPNFYINLIIYYQARWDLFLKPRIIGDLSCSIKISDKVNFSIAYFIWNDSKPVVSVDNLIYSLTSGLKINF